MVKLLVAVLTNEKPEELERCLQSVNSNSSPQERVVICNTQDTAFVPQAHALASEYGFDFRQTESNGNPGKGKNSLLKYFSETECDYVFPIDGDDYITPNAIDILNSAIQKNNFNALCLVGGKCVSGNDVISTGQLPTYKPWANAFREQNPTKEQWQLMTAYNELMLKHSVDGNWMNRVILVDKWAANILSFDENFSAFDDTHYFIRMKDMDCRNIMELKAIDCDDIYMYDISGTGTVVRSLHNGLTSDIKRFLDITKNLLTENKIEYVEYSQS